MLCSTEPMVQKVTSESDLRYHPPCIISQARQLNQHWSQTAAELISRVARHTTANLLGNEINCRRRLSSGLATRQPPLTTGQDACRGTLLQVHEPHFAPTKHSVRRHVGAGRVAQNSSSTEPQRRSINLVPRAHSRNNRPDATRSCARQ